MFPGVGQTACHRHPPFPPRPNSASLLPGLDDMVTLGRSRPQTLELGLGEAARRSCVNPIRSARIKHSPLQSLLRGNADPAPVHRCRENSSPRSSGFRENVFLYFFLVLCHLHCVRRDLPGLGNNAFVCFISEKWMQTGKLRTVKSP